MKLPIWGPNSECGDTVDNESVWDCGDPEEYLITLGGQRCKYDYIVISQQFTMQCNLTDYPIAGAGQIIEFLSPAGRVPGYPNYETIDIPVELHVISPQTPLNPYGGDIVTIEGYHFPKTG